ARVGEAHPQRLDRGRHRVGRVHAAAGARPGAGRRLDAAQGVELDPTRSPRAYGLEDADDGQVLVRETTRLDRAAVDVDGWQVEPREGDHAARPVLVASAHHQHGVQALTAADRLYRIGDDLAGDQAALHALRAHRDAVRDRDCPEGLRHAARSGNGLGGSVHQAPQAGVAGGDRGVAVRYADDRLTEVLLLEPDRAQHGPVGRTRIARRDDGAVAVQ